MSTEKLTFETIRASIDELYKKREMSIEIIPHNILPPQVVIKQGNKVYYSPQIKSGEVTIITLKEEENIFTFIHTQDGHTNL